MGIRRVTLVRGVRWISEQVRVSEVGEGGSVKMGGEQMENSCEKRGTKDLSERERKVG